MLNLVSGEHAGQRGPIPSLTGVFMSTVQLAPGTRADLPAPRGRSVLLYVVSGRVAIGGQEIDRWHLATLGDDGDTVSVEAPEDAVLLFGHADPIGEPVVSHGPFVMTTQAEIAEAIRDHQAGRFNGTGPLLDVGA
jgi:redox-sensitive bicupin YhaK (pirin superfamily)